jgi:hypothetical protein
MKIIVDYGFGMYGLGLYWYKMTNGKQTIVRFENDSIKGEVIYPFIENLIMNP